MESRKMIEYGKGSGSGSGTKYCSGCSYGGNNYSAGYECEYSNKQNYDVGFPENYGWGYGDNDDSGRRDGTGGNYLLK